MNSRISTMPLQLPTLDDRKYQDLLDEALARIPVHNPEWTNPSSRIRGTVNFFHGVSR